jgi:hypothetical protein
MNQDPAYITARLRLGLDDEAADLIEHLVEDADAVRRRFTEYVLEDDCAPWARNWRITCKRLGWPGLPRHPEAPPAHE